MSPRDTPAGPHGYPVADSPALGPVPAEYLTPEPLWNLFAPPQPMPREFRAPRQWFAELSEHLPTGFISARFNDLDDLRRRDRATPGEAAAYARAYLMAPHLSPETLPRMALPVVDNP